MIDREARKKTAELLQQFSVGKVTNFEFEENIPDSRDLVIGAIANSAWCFYDDFKEHKMVDEKALSEEMKSNVERWILFLSTDVEYEWPPFTYPGVRPLSHGFWSKLFGSKAKERKFMSSGDYSVWPFISRESYNRVQEVGGQRRSGGTP
ncbi:hypothetical protein ACJJIK_21540 [Microbulbifer sp. ZKSA006]|uniref:hypothetical protein n=1 Tax=Microbulbifer sp. ZKSA006 TaxID=3243390 RepID=UPI004039B5A0